MLLGGNEMKKLFAMLLVFSLCFTVLSCGVGKENKLINDSEKQEAISSISLEETSKENINEEEDLNDEHVDSFSIESKSNNLIEWTQWEYPEQYQVLSFTKEVSYKEKGSKFTVDGRYPQIDGMDDISFQIKINKALKELIKNSMMEKIQE